MTSIAQTEHPAASVANVQRAVSSLSAWELTAVNSAVGSTCSLVVALALACRHISIDTAFAAARLDEEHQLEHWGLVEGGHDLDRAYLRVRLASASTFLHLLGSDVSGSLRS